MKLKALTLDNYRQYEETKELEFPDGLVGVIGHNGAGKSTLMEAVAWALFGNAAARTDKQEIIRQGVGGKDPCRVSLDMEHGGKQYRVVREMSGRGLASDATVLVDRKPAAVGAKGALEYVTKLLGMDREAFFTSFFARQKELNALSDLRPADRKKLIIRMLGIDDVDRAIEFARADTRDLATKIATLGDTMEVGDRERLEAEKSVKEKEWERLRGELDGKSAAEAQAAADFERERGLFEAEEAKRELREELKRRFVALGSEHKLTHSLISQAEAEIARLRLQADRLAEISPAVEEHGRALQAKEALEKRRYKYEQLSGLLKERDRLRASLADKLERRRVLEAPKEKAEKFEGLTQAAQARAAEAHGREQAVRAKLAGLAVARQERAKQKRELAAQAARMGRLGPESECPTCLRKLGDDVERISRHLGEEIERLEAAELKIEAEQSQNAAELARVVGEAADIRDGLERLARAAAAIEDKAVERRLLERETGELAGRIEEIETKLPDVLPAPHDEAEYRKVTARIKELSKMRDECLRLGNSVERIPEETDRKQQLEERLADLSAEMERVRKDGEAVGFEAARHDGCRRAFESAREARHQAQLATRELRYKLELRELNLKELRRRVADIKAREKQIKKYRADRQLGERLVRIMTDFRQHIIGRIRPAISEKASYLLRELTDGKYSQVELDEDYELLIYDQGERFGVERFSGGEKDLANLCLRLAISQQISESSGGDYGFLVLDEIFGSQDSIRKNGLVQALAKLTRQFRQIFVITHIEDVKDQMEHVIQVDQDPSGASRARLVN